MSILDDEDLGYAPDEDDAASDGDICARCEHERSKHEGGKGPCECGRCKKFRDEG